MGSASTSITGAALPGAPARPAIVSAAPRRRWFEHLMGAVLLMCAVVSVLTTIGIVGVLAFESVQFFGKVSPWEFFTGTAWAPHAEPARFGIWPLFTGTFLVAFGSAIIAIPMGLGAAIYLSEYASPLTRDFVKPLLEILAGIPSVVFGYLAIVFVSPLVRDIFPRADVFNALNASIVVAIMILPMIVSLSEDVLRSVPRSLREGAYALGATKLDVTAGVIVPAALSGIMASFLLAIARAVGETMAVTLAAGKRPQLTFNPLDSIQTMTAYIVETTKGDTPRDTIEYQTIFAVGLTLFLTTLALNVMAQWILRRMREQYE
ncbi:MAG TPA: phosphate ABC transporter permease subunit PstC [Lacipirellulaceae bacterium]|nr:phosphate ABC transporter permease subunit PstC [Lacipirellulaceae bacterium]